MHTALASQEKIRTFCRILPLMLFAAVLARAGGIGGRSPFFLRERNGGCGTAG
jgi:hypothetical protein